MIEDIYEWLKTAGVKQEATFDQFLLWQELMLEEIGEMSEAYRNNDVEGMKDAFADILVVLTNWPYMANIPVEDLMRKIDHVSRSNWSKFCSSEDVAAHTVERYKSGTHPSKPGQEIDCYYEKSGDSWVVKRHDNKILKSINSLEPCDFS